MDDEWKSIDSLPGYSINRGGQVRGPSGKVLRQGKPQRGDCLLICAYNRTEHRRETRYVRHLLLEVYG